MISGKFNFRLESVKVNFEGNFSAQRAGLLKYFLNDPNYFHCDSRLKHTFIKGVKPNRMAFDDGYLLKYSISDY